MRVNGSEDRIGGLIGSVHGDGYTIRIEKNRVYGEITGVEEVGGLVSWVQGGTRENNEPTNILLNSTNGIVTGRKSVGGFIGLLAFGLIENNYALSEMGGIENYSWYW